MTIKADTCRVVSLGKMTGLLSSERGEKGDSIKKIKKFGVVRKEVEEVEGSSER